MAGQDVETEGTGEVGNDRARHRLHGRGHVRHRGIRRGDHQEIDVAGGARQVVVAAERALDPPPGRRQSTAEGEAGPTRADDA